MMARQMMKRVILIAVILGLGVFAVLRDTTPQSSITVTNAKAVPMGASGQMFMVTLDMQNAGPAAALRNVSSPNGAKVSLMNPGNMDAPLVIPGNGQGLLAMDGAHIMISTPQGGFAEGTFQPLVLGFDDGSTVSARVIRAPMGGMQHGMAHAVDATPAPRIAIIPPKTTNTGFRVQITVENFTFVRTTDDAPHVAGEGHAHIYLNGMKLGRLYTETFEIGALQPGAYTLRVALNTHDHRPYAVAGQPVQDTLTFNIP